MLLCRFLGRHALTLEWRGALPGVGEALRREIAVLVLVGGFLWGFVGSVWDGADLTIRLNEVSQAELDFGFAGIWTNCVMFFLCPRAVPHR